MDLVELTGKALGVVIARKTRFDGNGFDGVA